MFSFHRAVFFRLNPSVLFLVFLQTLENDVRNMTEEVKLSQALLAGSSGLRQEDRVLLADNLDCLKERLGALGCALGQRCDHMRTRAHELTAYQVCRYSVTLQRNAWI